MKESIVILNFKDINYSGLIEEIADRYCSVVNGHLRYLKTYYNIEDFNAFKRRVFKIQTIKAFLINNIIGYEICVWNTIIQAKELHILENKDFEKHKETAIYLTEDIAVFTPEDFSQIKNTLNSREYLVFKFVNDELMYHIY